MAALCVAVVGGVSAQQSFTSSDGALQFSYADGWFAEEVESRVIISNIEAGIAVGTNGDSAPSGMIVLIMTATANLAEIGNDADIAPSELIDTFLSATGMDGEVTEVEMNGYAVVQAVVTTLDTELNNTEAAVVAIGSANGTVFIIMETGDTLADYTEELMLVAESITLAGAAAPAAESSGDDVLAYNTSVTGTLSERQTEQFYTFNGTAGDTVTITMVADDNEALDTWLWLLTSEGFEGDDLVPVADNDDAADASVGSRNSQIADFVLPETGEYVIRATRFGGSGGYTLTLSSDDAPAGAALAAEPVIVRQWASEATASTQYGSVSWAASQATGEPNASDRCSDNGNAWASATTKTQEFLTVSYAEAVIPTEIHIYQVYNPGSITSVELSNSATGEIFAIPDSADPVGNTPCPGVFTVSVSDVETAFDTITIYIDQAPVASWTEIDAVELVGIDPTTASAPAADDSVASTDDPLGADPLTAQFGDGTRVTYPARFRQDEVSNTGIVITLPGVGTITHRANKMFSGTGLDITLAAVNDFYASNDTGLDPTRTVDVFGDGLVTQYQTERLRYFLTFPTANNTGKLMVVDIDPAAADPDQAAQELLAVAAVMSHSLIPAGILGQ
ncbi:MAG: pre-peptidase C-terminal domain-containing protein [Anaerolineae bacterium]|nr:pre-peptidase C-terminal domain-containing protein [Anaerolineae bacterium]